MNGDEYKSNKSHINLNKEKATVKMIVRGLETISSIVFDSLMLFISVDSKRPS